MREEIKISARALELLEFIKTLRSIYTEGPEERL